MLTFSDEQTTNLGNAYDEKFVKDMQAYCQNRHPDVFSELPEEELESRIKHGLARSRELKFKEQKSITTFIFLCAAIGPTLFSDKKFNDLLDMDQPSIDAKIEILAECIMADQNNKEA